MTGRDLPEDKVIQIYYEKGDTPPSGWITVTEMLAQVRSQHTPAEAVVLAADENELEIEFKTPQAIITPGQAVVLYAKDVVLGGGWIN